MKMHLFPKAFLGFLMRLAIFLLVSLLKAFVLMVALVSFWMAVIYFFEGDFLAFLASLAVHLASAIVVSRLIKEDNGAPKSPQNPQSTSFNEQEQLSKEDPPKKTAFDTPSLKELSKENSRHQALADTRSAKPSYKHSVSSKEIPSKLSAEQARVYVELLTHRDQAHLVTGPAGTGKTTLLYELQNTLRGKVVTLAPTGTAALQAKGQTIHSFFRLPARLIRYRNSDDIKLPGSRSPLRKIINHLESLILDEVSMVRADIVDAIDWVLREVRNRPGEPFGGVRVYLFGDTRQLEPVVSENEENLYLRQIWGGPFFFQARVWEEVSLHVHQLKELQRQREDMFFAHLLRELRKGNFNALHILNRIAVNPEGGKEPGTIILTPRRREAEAINASRLDKLPGRVLEFFASVNGEFHEKDFPTEPVLRLKPGAQVILLRNDPRGDYFNGDIGHIDDADSESVVVRLKRNGRRVILRPFTWEKIRYVFDRENSQIKPEVVGTFKQLPVKLAWALTIHKAQGLTLDRVHLDLGDGLFAHGQLYVALTRVRRIEDLTLSRPLREDELFWRPEVINFEEVIEREKVWRKARRS
jgi:DNA polymerase III delta prime subunit